MARPSLYQSDYARQARILCRLGGDAMRISPALLGQFGDALSLARSAHADFAAAVAIGSAQAASPVRPSLYKRATGYEYLAERVYAPRKDGTPCPSR
jgi:hypothetical protein